MAHVSSYLNRPLRTEAQARADRQRREAQETLAAPTGIAEAVGLAFAVWGAMFTFALWVV